MAKETSKEKRARYTQAAGAGADDRFGDEFTMDDSKRPDLLVEFFLGKPDVNTHYSPADLQECIEYVDEVLRVRREHLSRARARLKVARCLNDLTASARCAELVMALEGIVKALAEMRESIHAARLPVLLGASHMIGV